MTWLAQILATDPAAILNGLVAVLASAMWVRIEHRLTRIETNCKRCNDHK